MKNIYLILFTIFMNLSIANAHDGPVDRNGFHCDNNNNSIKPITSVNYSNLSISEIETVSRINNYTLKKRILIDDLNDENQDKWFEIIVEQFQHSSEQFLSDIGLRVLNIQFGDQVSQNSYLKLLRRIAEFFTSEIQHKNYILFFTKKAPRCHYH